MKKLVGILLVAVLSISIVACGGSDSSTVGEMSSKDVTVTSIDFTVPDGFAVSSSNSNMWFSPDYPTDGSNIYTNTVSKDDSFNDIDKAYMEENFIPQLKTQLNLTGDVEFTSFEHIVIDGFSATRMQFSYTLSGIKIEQIQYMIDADKTYIYTFTNAGDADWLDKFDKAAKAIKIKYTEN